MEIVIFWSLIVVGLFAIFSYVLMMVLLKVVNQLTVVNKTLLLLVAGKDGKPETLRALVASERPPQGKLQGIANKGKKEDKPKNMNYTLEIGGR